MTYLKRANALGHSARVCPTSRRLDAPRFAYADRVWWKGELYIAEGVELHGSEWRVALVAPLEFNSARGRTYFVPAHQVSAVV